MAGAVLRRSARLVIPVMNVPEARAVIPVMNISEARAVIPVMNVPEARAVIPVMNVPEARADVDARLRLHYHIKHGGPTRTALASGSSVGGLGSP